MPIAQEGKSYSLLRGSAGYRSRMDPVRRLIQQLAAERGIKLADLSRQVGKNHAYMQQFLKRSIPAKLPEDVRAKLAEALDVDEQILGAPLRETEGRSGDNDRSLITIPEHDVRASAGHGALIDAESVIGKWPFPRQYVRHTLSLSTTRLSMIEINGDSMSPTLASGDKVLVDLDDTNPSQPGVFALYDGDATVVKRVEKVPGTTPPEVMLISDNPKHNSYRVLAEMVMIAGRVVWFGRRL